jgi:hypothetical protein
MTMAHMIQTPSFLNFIQFTDFASQLIFASFHYLNWFFFFFFLCFLKYLKPFFFFFSVAASYEAVSTTLNDFQLETEHLRDALSTHQTQLKKMNAKVLLQHGNNDDIDSYAKIDTQKDCATYMQLSDDYLLQLKEQKQKLEQQLEKLKTCFGGTANVNLGMLILNM